MCQSQIKRSYFNFNSTKDSVPFHDHVLLTFLLINLNTFFVDNNPFLSSLEAPRCK